MKTTMFYLIQVFHQSLLLQMYENNNVLFNSGVSPIFTRCMKTTMFYLTQVFHQSLLLQMYENNNVLFNSGVSPIFTITDV